MDPFDVEILNLLRDGKPRVPADPLRGEALPQHREAPPRLADRPEPDLEG